jgi:hypothetical protein
MRKSAIKWGFSNMWSKKTAKPGLFAMPRKQNGPPEYSGGPFEPVFRVF